MYQFREFLPPDTIAGSYAPEDVLLLLKEVRVASTAVEEKEAAIQSGRRHYSEMISDEARPDALYMDLFRQAWDEGRERFARDTLAVAEAIATEVQAGRLPARVTLCSLVRAGLPLGVLLHRALRDMGVDSAHFGVSIIRDRGLDMQAMNFIARHRDPDGIIFVDGWTGKGAIRGELDRSWTGATGRRARLAVLADPAGIADLSGSREDWLIPTGILGANVSGLVSRSILSADVIGPGDFHGSMPAGHLADLDISRTFVDDIHAAMRRPAARCAPAHTAVPCPTAREIQSAAARAAVRAVHGAFGIDNPNRVKPGIAEATRAVLRRKPDLVLVRDPEDADLRALMHLCRTAEVPVSTRPDLTGPYRAVTLIARTS